MVCESSDVLNRCHSAYLYPLSRFFSTIGYPFSVFRIASRFPREKRVFLSVQRLVATASGPTLII